MVTENALFDTVLLTILVVSLVWQVIWLVSSNIRLRDEIAKLKEKND